MASPMLSTAGHLPSSLPAGNRLLNAVQGAVDLLCLPGHVSGVWSAYCLSSSRFFSIKLISSQLALSSGAWATHSVQDLHFSALNRVT